MVREETVELLPATYAVQESQQSGLVENRCPTAYSLEEQLAMKSYTQAIKEDDNEPKFIFCGEFLNSTFCLLHARFLLRLLLESKDGEHIPPTRHLTFNGLQGLAP
jgi:hypothetical protein